MSMIQLSNMPINRWSLLDRLKRAVKKISFLLSFDINRWKLSSMIGASSGRSRRLSFNDRPGLRACTKDTESSDSGSSHGLQRTLSFPSSEDDIDKRAEMFITNFKRQLQIERQISLKLRYCRGDSFESASPL
ncbi:unnamed protein product [Ilex paraguariensis]|uniref:Uncharacterized protein n=1 Tax=Ilex paraguariensis TaxID=185542 RepID=A0ABC8R7H1_9AQUA